MSDYKIKKSVITEFLVDEKVVKGFLGALLVTLIVSSGLFVIDSIEKDSYRVTVVTCETCEYPEFRDKMAPLFDLEYYEIDVNSSKGKNMVERYDLIYVPGFIFEKDIRNADNFSRIGSYLNEFQDSYAVPDTEVPTAQRLSEGRHLEMEHR